MARPSKIHRFAIFEDSGIPTPEPSDQTEFYDETAIASGREHSLAVQEEDCDLVIESDEEAQEAEQLPEAQDQNAEDADDNEADDERRESTLTATSISSYPESTYATDNDHAVQTQQPFTPPIIRPSFRRPQSVQRMRMTSPSPSKSHSQRQSLLSHSRSRAGTPRSVRSANARGSPRPRKRVEEELETEQKHYPLVLLHATLLPLSLPWSQESLHQILPAQALENLQLLRSKVSETLLGRGILIPHPREDYELLEERLLEALELKEERVTRCGHFRSRESTSSCSSADVNGRDSDSGLGYSLDGSDGELCATCQHCIKTTGSSVGSGNQKWTIKVFAANGLMRASAWSAAWPEMERVDVEILPWISDEMRKKLDERTQAEESEEQERLEDEEARIKEVVEEQVRVAWEEMRRGAKLERYAKAEERAVQLATSESNPHTARLGLVEKKVDHSLVEVTADLPQIYRPSQIPLSVLLKNYIYLLAQDRRNVFVVVLGVVALFFALRPMTVYKQAVLPPLGDACAVYQPLSSPLSGLGNTSADIMEALLTNGTTPSTASSVQVATATNVSEVPTPKDSDARKDAWPKDQVSSVKPTVEFNEGPGKLKAWTSVAAT